MTRRNGATSDWTPEMIATLKEYWGEKTSREIGEMIGKSKNCVMGKANRLGLKKLQVPGVRKVRVAPPRPAPRKPGRHFADMRAWADAPRADECQWLHGEPKIRDFCRETVVPGSSYCTEHYGRCIVRHVDYKNERA